MRPIVWAMSSPGSYSREGVIFQCRCRERGVIKVGESFKEIRYLSYASVREHLYVSYFRRAMTMSK